MSNKRSNSATSKAQRRCAPRNPYRFALDESAYTLQDVGRIVLEQAADVLLDRAANSLLSSFANGMRRDIGPRQRARRSWSA